MNFIKFGKSGPNLQRLNFENFEKRRSGSRWFQVVGTKDYPGELVWDQGSKVLGYLLCKSPRFTRKDRIVLGKEIIGIKSKNGFYQFGQNGWVAPKGFWGSFTIRGMVKTRMDQNQIKGQNQKGFLFLKETKSKKRFLRGQTQKMVFRKGLNDLLSNQARLF